MIKMSHVKILPRSFQGIGKDIHPFWQDFHDPLDWVHILYLRSQAISAETGFFRKIVADTRLSWQDSGVDRVSDVDCVFLQESFSVIPPKLRLCKKSDNF